MITETPTPGSEEAASSENAEATTEENTEGITDENVTAEPTETPTAAPTETPKVTPTPTETPTPTPTPVPTKRVYTGGDGAVSVTATLERADAVPDDANFIVNKVGETEDTIYYDIHFDAPVKDEKGNITGWAEFEPENGSVTVTFRFNENQLSDDLGAESAQDVTVVHVTDGGEEEMAASVSLSGSTDRVTFTTESFSIYYFKVDDQGNTTTDISNQQHTWNNDGTGNKNYEKIDDIASQIGSALEYSIYTNHLYSNEHLEGNIAAGVYETAGSSGNLNQDTRFIKGAGLKELWVAKELTGGDPSAVFRFRLVKKNGANNTVIAEFEVPANSRLNLLDSNTHFISGSAAAIEDALQSGPLFLYELDANGNIIENGGTLKQGDYDYKVSYSSTDSESDVNSLNQISTTGINNLIGTILTQSGIDTVGSYFGQFGMMTYFDPDTVDVERSYFKDGKLTIIFKDGRTLNVNVASGSNKVSDYIASQPGLTSGIASRLDSLKTLSANLANEKNGPVSGVAPDNKGKVNIINLDSTTGNLVQDLQAAGFNITSGDGQGLWLKGLLSSNPEDYDDDQYLVINIDCTGLTQYEVNHLYIDGYGLASNGGYDKLNSHVIFNFVQKNGDTFEAYTGIVKNTADTGGTILAPAATVKQGNGVFGGEVIANVVDRRESGQEIHKKTIISKSRVVTTKVKNSTTDGEIRVRKNLQGRGTWTGDDEFTFTITPNGDAPGFTPNTVTIRSGTPDHTASFGKVTFSQPGTYTWTVTEEHKGETIDGVAYDPQDKTITIKVIEEEVNGEKTGNLIADPSSQLVQTAEFTNVYSRSGTAEVKVKKTLEGGDWTSDDKFTFRIRSTQRTLAG